MYPCWKKKTTLVSSSKKIISSMNVHVWHHTKTTFHPFHDCKMNSIYVRHISHDQRTFSASNIFHLNFLKWTSSSVWMGFYDFYLFIYFLLPSALSAQFAIMRYVCTKYILQYPYTVSQFHLSMDLYGFSNQGIIWSSYEAFFHEKKLNCLHLQSVRNQGRYANFVKK